MKNEILIEIPCSERMGTIFIKSLKKEVEISKGRQQIDINYDESLIINIKTQDLVSLRAGVNTYLRLVLLILQITRWLNEC